MRTHAARRLEIGILTIALFVGLASMGAESAFAGEKDRKPASSKRQKPTPFAAPHLNHPVPSTPDWVVGVEVASKSQVEPMPRPVLTRPVLIQASDANPHALSAQSRLIPGSLLGK